jgi:hypothetical protein
MSRLGDVPVCKPTQTRPEGQTVEIHTKAVGDRKCATHPEASWLRSEIEDDADESMTTRLLFHGR